MTSYNSVFLPAAPILSIRLQHPHDDTRATPVQMLIDTGADLTCIPESAVSTLNLEKEHATFVGSYNGTIERRGIFHATLRIENYIIRRVRVVAIPGEIGILGRDILSAFTVTLRGKDQTFDIVDP